MGVLNTAINNLMYPLQVDENIDTSIDFDGATFTRASTAYLQMGNGAAIIGATNVIPVVAQDFNSTYWPGYNGTVITLTQNIVVPEWGATDAIRFQTTGGVNYTKCTTAGFGSAFPAGEKRTQSLWCKNNGLTRATFSHPNIVADAGIGVRYVDPGESKRIWFVVTGDGSRVGRFEIDANAAGDSLDLILWRPMIDGTNRNYLTDWTPDTRTTSSDPNLIGTGLPRIETVPALEGTTNILTPNMASVEADTTGFIALGSVTISKDTTEKLFGSGSLKVVTGNVAGSEGFCTEYGSIVIPCLPNTVYTLSVYLKGTGNIQLFGYTRDSANNNPGTAASPVIALTANWTRYTYTFTTNAVARKVYLSVRTSNQQGITFYADGLQIEQKPYATPFVIGTRPDASAFTGVNIEEGMTNAIPISAQKFDSVNWVAQAGCTVITTQDVVVPEWGAVDATRLQISASTYAYKVISVAFGSVIPAGEKRVQSFWCKNIGTKAAKFDHPNIVPDPGSDNIVQPGDSRRFSFVVTGTASPTARFAINAPTAADALDLILWRPCVDSANRNYMLSWHDSTRAGEILTIPFSGKLDPSKGTLEFLINFELINTATQRLFWLSRGSGDSNLGISLYIYSSNWGLYTSNDVAITTSQSINISNTPDGVMTFSVPYDSASALMSVNGKTIATLLTPNLPTAFGNLFIGSRYGISEFIDYVVFDVALSNIKRSATDIAQRAEFARRNGYFPRDLHTTWSLKG